MIHNLSNREIAECSERSYLENIVPGLDTTLKGL